MSVIADCFSPAIDPAFFAILIQVPEIHIYHAFISVCYIPKQAKQTLFISAVDHVFQSLQTICIDIIPSLLIIFIDLLCKMHYVFPDIPHKKMVICRFIQK